ncbi:DUF294 nucleotidyltransferase-like domain-containing protein [Spiribacter halobius]|uniref:Nucleotidyltransferase n=1 Tax=Sediminicurvatus halobius TaxID=2182432 RepID=A0A2U2N3B0_9GAMM|nr:DUF294 nucleotidyltransferase-like domain-containing protein [Spiribacter halobius]PWG63557.1 nucleotidyltransferase [Spiribacter halobius]
MDADAAASVRAFLEAHAPFDGLLPRHRQYFAEHCEQRDYAPGEVILEPRMGRVSHFHLVAAGRVRGERPDIGDDGSEAFELGEGDTFPMAALLGERATRTVYRAEDAVRCYRLAREHFERLFTESPAFRDYCIRGVSSLLEQVQQDIQRGAARSLGSESTLDMPLARLMRAEPLSCPPELSVREAVERMHARKVGSMVVVDEAQRPVGIFTLHDLRALIAARADLEAPIGSVMTPRPCCLSAETYAFEAVVEMAQRHIRHVVVTEGERLVGVVSERDLFALQRINVVHLMRAVARAESLDRLVAARGDISRLIDGMMAHGAGVEQMTRIITLLNDRTVSRVIELCLAEEDDPGVPFTWIAFGSEGRSEQTLVTDQDNAILFDPGSEDTVAVRQRLLPIARRINEALDRCGFPLCKGNIMASNPRLCLSFAEWEEAFRRIVASATPEHLLDSTIYFDFRPVWGDIAFGEHLHQRVLAMASGNSLFLHTLAGNALSVKPPLGVFRDFVTERDPKDDVHRLDLKIRGLTPFVDGARVLCLQAGIEETNTPERFARLAEAEAIRGEEAEAFTRSFAFVQLLRMREHQRQAAAGLPMHNRLDPETLNPMDRRILKEAFRQARRLQRKLEIRFHL